ncbi:alpha/beta-hydrolase [Exidia glandulosa HHB12029]|uniref:Alpha/beta-hydrolase n=1 Tax=Exidia glandulosa HHB12029 TaxID=1314781 RepID=A0A165DMC5_EXIGL|nr:alpha/beta-hydrolase [Exidia glandulosa HHB12029]
MLLLDIPYTSPPSARLTLDLHVHDSETKTKPLIVFVRGGAWIADDKSNHRELAARLSAATGCAVAVPNYSLSGPRNQPADSSELIQHPTHTSDVLRAFEFLRTWNGQPPEPSATSVDQLPYYNAEAIFAIGQSCGAHILGTMLLSPSESSSPSVAPSDSLLRAVRGVITTEGIFDIDLLLQSFPPYRGWFIESAFGASETYRDVSVNNFTARSTRIPWLLIHSTGDTLVDQVQSSTMYDRLRLLHGDDGSLVAKDWDGFDQEHDDVVKSEKFPTVVSDFVRTYSP